MIVPFIHLIEVINNISSDWARNVWGSEHYTHPCSGGTQTQQTQTNKQESKSVPARPQSSANETEPREQHSHESLLSWHEGKFSC